MYQSKLCKNQQSRILTIPKRKGLLQLKKDHLFNDLPSAFSRKIPDKYINQLANVRNFLNSIRDNTNFICDNVYPNGVDDTNSVAYSSALRSFRIFCENYNGNHASSVYPVISELFDSSIDPEVEKYIKNKHPNLVQQMNTAKMNWKSQKTNVNKVIIDNYYK